MFNKFILDALYKDWAFKYLEDNTDISKIEIMNIIIENVTKFELSEEKERKKFKSTIEAIARNHK
jgi:hypothetical protein